MNFSIGEDDYIYETGIERLRCKQKCNHNYNSNCNHKYNYDCNSNCKSYCVDDCCDCCHNYNHNDICNKQCYHECYKHYEDFFDKFCDKFLEKCGDKCNNKPCNCCKCCCCCDNKKTDVKSILQASVNGQVFTSSNISFTKNLLKGTNIQIEGESLILLAKGHIYQVSYNMNAVGDLLITPQFNGVGQAQYSAQNITSKANQNISASATFLIDTTEQELYLDLLFDAFALSRNVVGNIAVVEIQ